MMMRGVLLALLLACAAPAVAGEVVFYRCTDAQGALTVQNMPCPKGMQQTKKVMQAVEAPTPVAPVVPVQAPAPSPAPELAKLYPAPADATEAKAAATPEAAVTAPEPEPLPPLFECRPRGGEAYLSETAEPPSRCVEMRVTGLDGNPRTAAGDACEVVRDTCTAVPAAQHCAVWRKRVLDAEGAWRFAASSRAEELKREYQRLQALFDASDCAAQNP